VELGGNFLTDEGARAVARGLASVTSLRKLIVYGNKLTDAGAEALAPLVQANPHLQSIYVDANRIANRGAGALVEALGDHADLRTVSMSMNYLGDSAVERLASVLRGKESVVEVDVSRNWLWRRKNTGALLRNALPPTAEVDDSSQAWAQMRLLAFSVLLPATSVTALALCIYRALFFEPPDVHDSVAFALLLVAFGVCAVPVVANTCMLVCKVRNGNMARISKLRASMPQWLFLLVLCVCCIIVPTLAVLIAIVLLSIPPYRTWDGSSASL